MGSSSFAADAINNPSRYYRRPRQVVQDRRLSRQEKLAILQAWEAVARSHFEAVETTVDGEPSLLTEVTQARLQIDEPANSGPTRAATRQDGNHQLTAHRVR